MGCKNAAMGNVTQVKNFRPINGKCYKFFSDYYPSTLPCSGITKDVCLGYIQYLQQNHRLKDVTFNTYLRGISSKTCSDIWLHGIEKMASLRQSK